MFTITPEINNSHKLSEPPELVDADSIGNDQPFGNAESYIPQESANLTLPLIKEEIATLTVEIEHLEKQALLRKEEVSQLQKKAKLCLKFEFETQLKALRETSASDEYGLADYFCSELNRFHAEVCSGSSCENPTENSDRVCCSDSPPTQEEIAEVCSGSSYKKPREDDELIALTSDTADSPDHKRQLQDKKEEQTIHQPEWTTDSWRTPNTTEHPIVSLVERALGGKIGLDPTADSGKSIPAEKYFLAEDNCLEQDDWTSPAGTVFMNPPRERPSTIFRQNGRETDPTAVQECDRTFARSMPYQ